MTSNPILDAWIAAWSTGLNLTTQMSGQWLNQAGGMGQGHNPMTNPWAAWLPQAQTHNPWAALTGFADPSVSFGLQFEPRPGEATATRHETKAKPEAVKPEARTEATMHALPAPSADAPAAAEPAKPGARTGEVVTLDAFRKK